MTMWSLHVGNEIRFLCIAVLSKSFFLILHAIAKTEAIRNAQSKCSFYRIRLNKAMYAGVSLAIYEVSVIIASPNDNSYIDLSRAEIRSK